MGRGVWRSCGGHGPAGSASASCGGDPDRGLKLPAAAARRTDARACALQGADHAAGSGAGPASSRPTAEKWPDDPGDVTGTSGEFYFGASGDDPNGIDNGTSQRSEEHTSELQSRQYLVCRLLLEKKKIQKIQVNV